MNDSLAKFQELLWELFQFDCADLDFGIYRIMNYKRDVIERFIARDLPRTIAEELNRGALADQAKAKEALEAARQKVLDALGDDAFDAEGNLAEQYHTAKAGKEYLEARAKAAGARDHSALETAIYNHLYAFFSRYYQDGDFISHRYYSRRQRYAIPYNGEEVYLYWANHDQYYVKTGEYFTDYSFTAPNGVTVHFKLQSADVEQNNVKGEKRFFLPRTENMTWDEATRVLTIPFEYRPLTEQENIAYGQKNQQEAIIAEALRIIPEQLSVKTAAIALAALTAEKRRASDGRLVNYLEHHLRQYTRRNTSDFFIHKDLKSFLSRELDFYLKNEVLNLDEMEAAGEKLADGWFQMMRIIKAVGGQIIEFLHQIEEFQKMLWEKRKFITETQYCITMGNIAEEFYAEIAACEPQWEEWRELGMAPAAAGVFLGTADVSSACSVPSAAEVACAGVPSADVPSAGFPPSSGTADVPSALPTPPATKHKGWHTRGYLPHYDAEALIQSVTFRLHDSVPAEVIQQWKQELRWREGLTPDSEQAEGLRKRIEKYQDAGAGACYLRDERVARVVRAALEHFDGKRYRLIAWCIMPNHVHVLFEPLGHSLSDIVHSWKSFTAHKANEILGRAGPFWAPEYYDRFIRDEKHFVGAVEYILNNPVQAGLASTPEEWPWSGCAAAERGFVSEGGGRDVRGPGDGPDPSGRRDSSGGEPGYGPRDGAGSRDVIRPRLTFLKTHPTLVLDTKHFDRSFVDRLLGSFDDLDEMTDGLLVHSENWQALSLLQERYRERVSCVYIDPPYNTGTDGFLYRDNYQHSSWLALLENRLLVTLDLIESSGLLFCSIDDIEVHRLRSVLDRVFGPDRFVGTLTWVATTQPDNIGRARYNLQQNVEYILLIGKCPRTQLPPFKLASSGKDRKYPHKGRFGPCRFEIIERSFEGAYARPTMQFEILGQRPRPGKQWQIGEELARELEREGKLEIVDGIVKRAVYPEDEQELDVGFVPFWAHLRSVGTSQTGKSELTEMIGRGHGLDTVKPVSLIASIGCRVPGPTGVYLDFFAGSGTTGHAVINLNREDGGCRKFILVEMADYFDTVLLPRIKKVTFSPEWKDGRPKRMATAEEAERSPRIVKYIRLESYEDALNNIAFDDASGQRAMQFDDYLLKYMLKWETRRSETLLNVERLTSPFSYKLNIYADGQTREKLVDIPETFSYLLGLHVETRRAYDDNGRRYLVYHGKIDHRSVVVIWRETEGWQQSDYERDRDFVADQKLADGADEVFVNGDSFIPGARALEPVFKARMFAPVEA